MGKNIFSRYRYYFFGCHCFCYWLYLWRRLDFKSCTRFTKKRKGGITWKSRPCCQFLARKIGFLYLVLSFQIKIQRRSFLRWKSTPMTLTPDCRHSPGKAVIVKSRNFAQQVITSKTWAECLPCLNPPLPEFAIMGQQVSGEVNFLGCTKKILCYNALNDARIVQRSGPQPSKLMTRIRIPLRAPKRALPSKVRAKCEIDGIGRRDGLKIRWRNPCRFKSGISHHFNLLEVLCFYPNLGSSTIWSVKNARSATKFSTNVRMAILSRITSKQILSRIDVWLEMIQSWTAWFDQSFLPCTSRMKKKSNDRSARCSGKKSKSSSNFN